MKFFGIVLITLVLNSAAFGKTMQCDVASGGQVKIDLDVFTVDLYKTNPNGATSIQSIISANTLCGKTYSTESFGVIPAYGMDERKIIDEPGRIYFSTVAIADAKSNRKEAHYYPWSVHYSKTARQGLFSCMTADTGKNSSRQQWLKIPLQKCQIAE